MQLGTMTTARKINAIKAKVGPMNQSAAPMSVTPPITRAAIRLNGSSRFMGKLDSPFGNLPAALPEKAHHPPDIAETD